MVVPCPFCNGLAEPTGEFAFVPSPVEIGPVESTPPMYQVHRCQECGEVVPPPWES